MEGLLNHFVPRRREVSNELLIDLFSRRMVKM